MFSGWGLKGLDGTAWSHPLRLTIDARAVADRGFLPVPLAAEVTAILATRRCPVPVLAHPYAPDHGSCW